jgi:hypothetical protein
MHRRLLIVGLGVAVVAALGVGVAVFQPHKLFIDDVVDEARPDEATPTPTSGAPDLAAPSPTTVPPLVGTFVSLDHPTTGRAEVLTGSDGRRVLRLEDFTTDNGPDLFVYLSTAPADGSAPFDAEFVNIGGLKGNVGNQNYDIPAEVDLGRFATVVIWCRQFTSAFGVAGLFN